MTPRIEFWNVTSKKDQRNVIDKIPYQSIAQHRYIIFFYLYWCLHHKVKQLTTERHGNHEILPQKYTKIVHTNKCIHTCMKQELSIPVVMISNCAKSILHIFSCNNKNKLDLQMLANTHINCHSLETNAARTTYSSSKYCLYMLICLFPKQKLRNFFIQFCISSIIFMI